MKIFRKIKIWLFGKPRYRLELNELGGPQACVRIEYLNDEVYVIKNVWIWYDGRWH